MEAVADVAGGGQEREDGRGRGTPRASELLLREATSPVIIGGLNQLCLLLVSTT